MGGGRGSNQFVGVDANGQPIPEVAPDPAGTTAPDPGAAGSSDAVKQLLGGVNTYQGDIYNLTKGQAGPSAAEAQLKQAQDLARIQAGINTQDSQRSALGIARGGRNRGDRALLERQAIGEAGYIGTDAARSAVLVQAENLGVLSKLRADEDTAFLNFKLDALKTAAGLGLDTASLLVNIDSINISAATEKLRLGLGYAQLDEEHAKNILEFTQQMAAIEFNYTQLSTTDQQEATRVLMTKYGIDADTRSKLEAMRLGEKQSQRQFFGGLAGGAIAGATAGLANVSDERAKTNISEVKATAQEFEDFMSAVTANTYEYKEPEKHGTGLRFGLMAQDLEKTKLGQHMVRPDATGTKTVQIGPLALATASGLSLVHERLKELEQSLAPRKPKAARS
jgi:hypothetical protein